MIDTVTYDCCRPLRLEIATAISMGNAEPLLDWYIRSNKRKKLPGREVNHSNWKIEGWHKSTGMHFEGSPYRIERWTVSLARLASGFNGVQINADFQIEKAINSAIAVLAQIAGPSAIPETLRRLDVARNIAHPEPQRLVLALRDNHHPWIRRETECYAVGSVRYHGTEVVFNAYWKKPPERTGSRSRAWKTPKVLRLEVQLKKPGKIEKFLGAMPPALPGYPNCFELYQALRSFMLEFPRREQLNIPFSMPAVLALCQSQGVRLPSGETLLDWHRSRVGDSAHRKMRGRVARIIPQFLAVDWGQIFPANRIPESVDVEFDGSTRLVPSAPIPNL